MITEFEEEVQREANLRTFEVLIKLIDQIELDFDIPTCEMLHKYVRLKLIRHKVKKTLRYGYHSDELEIVLENKFRELTTKIKEARVKYYESKRRHEAY